MEWDSLLITTLKQYIENVHYQLELIWINEKKEAKSNIYACCLFGSSLGFPFGAQ